MSADKKIALIGTSNAGKTTCAAMFGFTPADADMDKTLPAAEVPTVDKMLRWILEARSPVVAVSVHVVPLKAMMELKLARQDDRFAQIHFVYLYANQQARAERHKNRHPNSDPLIESPGYKDSDDVFRKLMDDFIDTTSLSPEHICKAVREIAARVGIVVI